MQAAATKAAFFIAATACGAAAADEPPLTEQKVAPTAFNQEEPEPKLLWGTGSGKSYWVPAADIVLFDVALNLFDRQFIDPREDFTTTWSTIEDNFHASWVFDEDTFEINQFGHPYQGSMYHNFARSAGLGYWPAWGYTFLGSAFWEIAGETTPPSVNDQTTTGIAGALLGEPLFRMASLMFESAEGRPSFWRGVGAAAISPAMAFNRWAYGRRFDGVFRSRDPAVHTRAQLGANLNAKIESDINLNPDPATPAIPQSYKRGEPVADFLMVYGLPGKPGYRYDQPFDYFVFQFTAAPGNFLENLITRGMLWGRGYAVAEHYRGIWGIYGSYDFIAPQVFRVSSTALGLGTTGQWWLTRSVALQGELVGGMGYGSGGVARRQSGERDYHYGLIPQGLVTLRAIFGDDAALELTAREYRITDRGSDASPGSENIGRAEAGLTVRVFGLHGVTLKYTVSRRDAHYGTRDTRQTVAAVNLGYTYLGHKWFGAVDWRPDAAHHIGDRP